MSNFRIGIGTGSGVRAYRSGNNDGWDLEEAAKVAAELLERHSATHVTVGDGEHEFRLLPDNDGDRWADWYVDAELVGVRWRYRPLADLDDYGAADELAEEVAELAPDVTRVWIGDSAGTEEYESETGTS